MRMSAKKKMMIMMERGKEESQSKKWLLSLLVVLFVVGTCIAPMAAAKNNDQQALKHLDKELEALDANPRLNTFAYNVMLEYANYPELNPNEGLKAVKIVIINGRWWRGHGYKEVKTFYVVRNDDDLCIDLVDPSFYDAGDDEDSLWTFYPSIGQSTSALNIIASCFKEDCECTSYHKAVLKFIRLGKIAIMVDKDDNVPGITEIFTNSHWLGSYLPQWAKDLLERFERRH
jgi:hypothetical protein